MRILYCPLCDPPVPLCTGDDTLRGTDVAHTLADGTRHEQPGECASVTVALEWDPADDTLRPDSPRVRELLDAALAAGPNS